jgi:Glycosyltransferase
VKNHKILQICAIDFTVKHFLLPLIDRLKEEGFDVRTVCSEGPYTQEMVKQGYNIYNIEIVRKISPIMLGKATWQLYKYIRREQFDIVHVHTPVASIVGRLAAKLAGVKTILYTAHGFYFHDGMSAWKRRLLILIEKFMGRFFTDLLFTQSHEDFELAVREGIIDRERAFHIGNGIDTSRFIFGDDQQIRKTKRRELGINERARIVGFVGRLVREKGIIDLISAFAVVAVKRPDVQLLVIGDKVTSERDIDTKEAVLRLIEGRGLSDKVIFTGRRTDVNELLAAMDIFVLPSYREGMPRSIIEAMAAGRPVIATDIRGCREEVVHGETGYLVPVAAPESLAEKIAILLDNPDAAQEMGRKGRKRVQTLFDERLVLNKQVAALFKLAEER